MEPAHLHPGLNPNYIMLVSYVLILKCENVSQIYPLIYSIQATS